MRSRLSVAQKTIDDPEFAIDALKGKLDQLEAAILDVTTSLEGDLETANPLIYDRILLSLTNRQMQVNSWNLQFIAHTQQLADLRSELRTDAGFFDNLTGSDQAEDLPSALIEKVVVISRDIDTVRSRLAEKLNGFVSLRGRISDYQSGIDAALEKLEQTTSGFRGRRVRGTNEPLLPALKPWQSPAAALADGYEILNDTWTNYRPQHRIELITLFSMLPVLLLLVWALRRSALAHADTANHEMARSIFVCRPVATAFLIWLTLGPQLVTENLPLVLSNIAGGLLILALLRVLFMVVQPDVWLGPVRGLLFLTLVLLSASVIFPAGPVHRLTTFGVALVTVPILLRLIKIASSLPADKRSRFPGLVGWIAKIGIGAMAVTLAGELYGAVAMAEQILYALLIANLVFTVFLVNDLVLKTGWEILLESRSASRINVVRRHRTLVRRRGVFIIRLALIVFILSLLPGLFPLFDLLKTMLAEFMSQEWTLGNIQLSPGNLWTLTVGMVLALYIPRFVRFIMDEDIVPRLSVDPGSGAAATRLTYYALVLIGIGLALASAGFEFGQLALIIGALGVGIPYHRPLRVEIGGADEQAPSFLILRCNFRDHFRIDCFFAAGRTSGVRRLTHRWPPFAT